MVIKMVTLSLNITSLSVYYMVISMVLKYYPHYPILYTHMLHVWSSYEHLPPTNRPNVGKYTIHGALGVQYVIRYNPNPMGL